MNKMKMYRVVILITALLIVGNVNAQEPDISRLKTQSVTLTRNVSKDKKTKSSTWTLVESDVKQVRPVEFRNVRTADDISSSLPSTDVPAPPQPEPNRSTKRRYSISYGGFSVAGDYQWLRLEAAPAGGTGLIKDIGEMNWAEVDRMPTLVPKPITSGFILTHIEGQSLVGPAGLVVRAVAGHVYAVQVTDEHTNFRAIFRVESIDSNGDCKLTWRRIPTKKSSRAELQAKQPKVNESPAKVSSPYAGPPANEILTKVASVYAGCRTYTDEGLITSDVAGLVPSHFRTTFSRPETLGFEFWQDNQAPWVVWKKGDEVRNWRSDGLVARPAPLDTALGQAAFNSKGSSLLVPPLLIPNLFRTADTFALIVDPKLNGEDKIDGFESIIVSGKLWGQTIDLWIDKTDYVIRKVVRVTTVGNQPIESTIRYKPKLNSDIPPENLTYKPPAGKENSGGVNSMTVKGPALTPPSLAPRLRNFGSSLSRGPNEKAIAAKRSADDDDVVRVDTDLVLSSVLVLNPEGKIVIGLTKEDFIVKEDNNLQQVTSFSLGDNKDLPRSIVLIVDYSPSQLPYIRTSIESAKMLVDKLNPKDRMALVTDDVQLLTDFTSDKKLLKEKLDGLKSSALSGVMGASVQYDALMATLNELFDNEDVQPIVIFQTDGDQLDSLKGGKAAVGPYTFPRKYGFADVLTAAERVRATIYPVISGVRFLGVSQEELLKRARLDLDKRRAASREMSEAQNTPARPINGEPTNPALLSDANRWLHCQTALAELAKSAGAWAEFLEEPEQADEIYTRVLKNIEIRYLLGYYPTDRARDGKRRTVKIEVRNHPEYIIVGHKSYMAREE